MTTEPSEGVEARRAFVLPPVHNGLDYLVTAVDYLGAAATPPGRGSLKYAVLHLQAATEVLLKARLVEEHWSLVFAKPGEATREKFDEGDFNSCTLRDVFTRLEQIAGVRNPELHEAIQRLTTTRNALTHFGHLRRDVSAATVERTAAEVTMRLLQFIHLYLRPALCEKNSDAIRHVGETMAALRSKLGSITSLVEHGMRALGEELAVVAERTVECPDCRLWAFVVGKPDRFDKSPLMCRFCFTEYDLPGFAESDYVSDVLGGRSGRPYAPCSACGESMVIGARTVKSPEGVALCFSCGAVTDVPR
ncbi:hypothetical protein [Pilimelia terevasa]|nr:hypothetical protein [Pilimelia terevasa]